MKKTIKLAIGLVIGVALLWLLFRNTDWHEVLDAIRNINIWWMLIAFVAILASFFARIQRWSYIVRTAKPVSFRHMFSATQIGFLVNFSVGGRIGEVVRAVVLSRLAQLRFPKTFAMVALDRVTDLIGLVMVVLVAVLSYSPADEVVIPEETFGAEITFAAERVTQFEVAAVAFLAMCLSVFVMLYVKQSLVIRIAEACAGVISKRLAAWVRDFLQHFADGFHIFRSASDMLKCVFFSLVTWGLALIAIHTSLLAFGIDAPWYAAFVIELLLAVAISAPGTPGFVGQFHIPIVIALVMLFPDIDISKAKALAIVAHIANLIPVYIIGIFCLYWEGFGFLELTRQNIEPELETHDTSE